MDPRATSTAVVGVPGSGTAFLHDFLSRFAAFCRNDPTSSSEGASQGARTPHESRHILVKIVGDVLFHCSTELAQVCTAVGITPSPRVL